MPIALSKASGAMKSTATGYVNFSPRSVSTNVTRSATFGSHSVAQLSLARAAAGFGRCW